jgi:hypothetical protein
MSVALATAQRRVADWPRSMVRGSAVKLVMRAAGIASGLGVPILSGGTGPGGVAVLTGGVGFGPQAVDNINNETANTTVLSVLVLIRILNDPFALTTVSVYRFRPHRLCVISGGG